MSFEKMKNEIKKITISSIKLFLRKIFIEGAKFLKRDTLCT